MLPMAKILVPVDFSARSAGAAHYARTLAFRFRSEVKVLHVLTPAEYALGGLEVGGAVIAELYANRMAKAGKDLDQFLAENFEGVSAKPVILEGDAARTITIYAHSEEVGLIVLPTHGYGPFRRFILGSTTAKVLHDADCPVWTGTHMETAPPVEAIFFRNILCAVDLGPQSARALEWAVQMADEYKARLTLVHATSDPATREAIDRLQDRMGTDADAIVESGDPPQVVHAAAEKTHADLVVIGRSSAAGVVGRLRASAYAIIRESPCPVVSV